MLKSQQVRSLSPEMDPLRMGMGWTVDDLSKPQIMVESTYGNSHPGSGHLNIFVEEAVRGVNDHGGKAARYFATDMCDGMAQGHDGINYSLAHREAITNLVEAQANATTFDGGVFISSCDKAMPAMLMSIGRMKDMMAAIVVTGGVMEAHDLPAKYTENDPGCAINELLTLEQIGKFSAQYERGEIPAEQLTYYKQHACPSCGACSFMGTASTMQVMAEALGLMLPGTALMPATAPELKQAAYDAGAQLMKLVDLCHQNQIGIIIDFVPVHFAVDGYALAHYDGTTLYEYPEKEDTYSEWGSCNFIHARGEVCSFLQSCANFWLTEFHFDGIRMDAVSRLLYWGGDPNRGENPSSIRFLKNMNRGLKERHPSSLLIAEDSTCYPNVTKPVAYGGLGFDYKWDMGWMNDTLNYFRQYPWCRSQDYHNITFSMMYFPNEYYLLPLSHDENVHGKATIMQKMFGEYEQKFPQARLLYLYMYAHPGKKLLFMGSELGQLREWTEEQQQDWDILKYPIHDAFHHYMLELNRLYLTEPALYQDDYERDGFCWVDCHQEAKGIYAMERRAGDSRILILLHMSDEATQTFTFTLPDCGSLKPLLHTDWKRFHGSTEESKQAIVGDVTRTGMQFTLKLPPFSGIMLRIQPKKQPAVKKPAARKRTVSKKKTSGSTE
mgnify:CR=1 FL=1